MSSGFSEGEFLSKLFPLLNTDGVLVPPGDDCAVVEVGGKKLSISVDQLIQGKHYLPETDPYRAGKKLMARNLSDLAAMGAKPLFALISSATGPDKDEDWLLRFHEGIVNEADKYGTIIIGGDLAQAPTDTLASLTIIGENESAPLLRSGACDSDALYVTGEFGRSFPSEHHLNFSPRVEQGIFLVDFASAMIDITDGLLLDCSRVSLASGLGVCLEPGLIPPRKEASIQERLTDGEDYELLFAVSKQNEKKLQSDWPFSLKLTKIGHFSKNIKSGQIIDSSGIDLAEKYGSGFDHFNGIN